MLSRIRPDYTGKVRDIYKFDKNFLLIHTSDRVSSFDRHLGLIPGKGQLLTQMNKFWFEKTRHIIDNHLVATSALGSLVTYCNPIKIEIVVRAYITGNTVTSLWTHYNAGERNYCGLTFPDGLKKNQKLPEIVITPTTKGDEDIPISAQEIVDQGYMTREECDFVFEKAMALFIYGQEVVYQAGFILVDTKYEFGRTPENNIILIDELHTCDSSRYWLSSSYQERFQAGLEPEKLDKDCVRDWVRSQCDPYKDGIPQIPQEIIDRARDNYELFYNKITGLVSV